MAEPIKHGGDWWTQARDGSWLRWNVAEHRWDPQAGGPPPGIDAGAAEPEAGDAAAPPPRSGTGAGPFDSTALGRQLRDFDSARGKGRAASVLVGVTSAVSLVVGPWALGRAVSPSGLFVESPVLAGLSTAALFAFLASAVAVVVWFRAAFDNAAALGASDLRFSPGWAIGGWILPIANLFIPKKIADDVWRASDPALPVQAGARWKFEPVPARLHIWWTLWVVQLISSRVADQIAARALVNRNLSDYRFGIGLQGASAILLALAGVLLIWIIAGISARQDARAREARSLLDGPVPAA